jgi:hypothetical protein
MPLYMPPNDNKFEDPPVGMHVAYCYRLLDLGTHDEPYQGQTDIGRRILVGFEFPGELMSSGKPFTTSRFWKYSSNEKSRMRKDLDAWRGIALQEKDFGPGGFDITKVVGAKCMITLKETFKDDGSRKVEWAGIGPVPKGLPVPPRVNDLQLLILEKGEFNRAVYESLPEKLKDKIARSPEYMHLMGATRAVSTGATAQEYPAGADRDFDDNLPF